MTRTPAAAALLRALEEDSFARLKWRVLTLLHVSPLSARARLMTKSQVLRCACHLALDNGAQSLNREQRNANQNPNFDMARFAALGGKRHGI